MTVAAGVATICELVWQAESPTRKMKMQEIFFIGKPTSVCLVLIRRTNPVNGSLCGSWGYHSQASLTASTPMCEGVKKLRNGWRNSFLHSTRVPRLFVCQVAFVNPTLLRLIKGAVIELRLGTTNAHTLLPTSRDLSSAGYRPRRWSTSRASP